MTEPRPTTRVVARRPAHRPRRTDTLCLAALTILWMAIVALVDPRGDFPLNDDWAYGLPALHLADTGTLRFTNFQSMPLITQTIWGALHASLFGASFTTLRLSMLVAAWAGVVLFYLLMRQCTRPALSLLAATVLAANPLYVALAHTFMTDVFFLALTLAAVLAFWRAMHGETHGALVLATTLSVAATLTRQVGLAIPLAWACACLWRGGDRQRRGLSALAPPLVTFAALVAYSLALEATQALPRMYMDKSRGASSALLDLVRLEDFALVDEAAWALLVALVYVGLLTLPFSLVAAPAGRWIRTRHLFSARWLLVILFAPPLLGSLSCELPLPLTGNILTDFGIGPRTLIGTPPAAPPWVWCAISFVAWAGAAWLVLQIAAVARRLPAATPPVRPRLVFVTALGLLLLAPAALTDPFYDRYLLPLVALMMVGLACLPEATQHRRRWKWSAAVALMLPLLCFSVAGTHDYLAWNRARWEAVAWLQSRGIAIDDIDGGFEVNNVYRNRRALAEEAELPSEAVYTKPAAYEIWFDPPAQRNVLECWECRTWLPWAVRRICVVGE